MTTHDEEDERYLIEALDRQAKRSIEWIRMLREEHRFLTRKDKGVKARGKGITVASRKGVDNARPRGNRNRTRVARGSRRVRGKVRRRG